VFSITMTKTCGKSAAALGVAAGVSEGGVASAGSEAAACGADVVTGGAAWPHAPRSNANAATQDAADLITAA